MSQEIDKMYFWGQYCHLLNVGFGVPPHRSFLDDFPIYSSENFQFHQRHLGTQLVSGCGLFRGHLKVPKFLPKAVQLIGGVVTDPVFQKQGYASELIKIILENTKQKKEAMQLKAELDLFPSITVLWTLQNHFYEKIGFMNAGKQVHLSLDQFDWQLDWIDSFKKASFFDVRMGWQDMIFCLMLQRKQGLVRRLQDIEWVKAHKNVLWVSLWGGKEKNKLISFIGYERGIDMGHTVHEWGGAFEGVVYLLDCLRNADLGVCLLANQEFVKDAQAVGLIKKEIQWAPHCLIHCGDAQMTPSLQQWLSQIWFWGLDAV